jgi:hypothetical protein
VYRERGDIFGQNEAWKAAIVEWPSEADNDASLTGNGNRDATYSCRGANMRAILILALCTPFAVAAPAPDVKDDPPAKKALFAKEDWYKDQKAKEETFEGVIQRKKVDGVELRAHPYQLIQTVTVNAVVEQNVGGVITKKIVTETRMLARDIYVPGKADLLDGYLGKMVRITGKFVTFELADVKLPELWPGAIEVVKDDKKPEEKKAPARKDEKDVDSSTEVKILGRGVWRLASKSDDQQQIVIRNAEELAKASGLEKPDGEEAQKKATEAAAKALKVDDIDWKKQMLIVVTGGVKRTGGYSVEITKIETSDKVMTVHWKLNSPKPGSPVTQTITHPAQTVIVEQFEGKVVFDPPAAKGGDKEK